MSRDSDAWLKEIFLSAQGEGAHVGERHLFVRFARCHRRCRYCDTDFSSSEAFRLERVPGSVRFDLEANPVSPARLVGLVEALDPSQTARRLTLTGGEPLLHAEFLGRCLPKLVRRRIHLETAGDLPDALESILSFLDAVAMDVKLPSVSGGEPAFEAHAAFLRRCAEAGVETCVKIVVSDRLDAEELARAVRLVSDAAGADLPLILQPLTPKPGLPDRPPNPERLLAWQEMALKTLSDVRLIPQTHLAIGLA